MFQMWLILKKKFKRSIEIVQTCMWCPNCCQVWQFTEICFFLEFCILKIRDCNIEWSHFLYIKRLHIKAELLQIVQHIKDIRFFFISIFGCGWQETLSAKLQKSICKTSFGLFWENYCHDLNFILILSELLEVAFLGMCSNLFSWPIDSFCKKWHSE